MWVCDEIKTQLGKQKYEEIEQFLYMWTLIINKIERENEIFS